MGIWKEMIGSHFCGFDKQGEPIFRDKTTYICSECGRRTIIKENYCPTCGGKMVKDCFRGEIDD